MRKENSRRLRNVYPPRLHRRLERSGEELGLPVSRLSVDTEGRVLHGPATRDLKPKAFNSPSNLAFLPNSRR